MERKREVSMMQLQGQYNKLIKSPLSYLRWGGILIKQVVRTYINPWKERNRFYQLLLPNIPGVNDFNTRQDNLSQDIKIAIKGMEKIDIYLMKESWNSLRELPVAE